VGSQAPVPYFYRVLKVLRKVPLQSQGVPPLALLDEPVLFGLGPGGGVVLPVSLFIVPIFILGTSAGPPRIISLSVLLCGSWLISYDDPGCGLMEPSDPTSLYVPAPL
jgi:hypothetical protein